jgi:hypothetical protein
LQAKEKACEAALPPNTGLGSPVEVAGIIADNIRLALDKQAELSENAGILSAEAQLYSWLKNQFRIDGDWDYKIRKIGEPEEEPLRQFGNFNFGAVMKALGFNKVGTTFYGEAYSIWSRHELDDPQTTGWVWRGFDEQTYCNYQALY